MRRKRAVGWAYVLTWGRQGIQTVSMFIVASIVGPSDFGLMALGLVYIGFMEMLLQQGFFAALVQRPTIRQTHASSVFWLTLVLSVVIAAFCVLLRPFWVALSGDPALDPLLLALSLSIPLMALRIVPSALLTRHFRMKALTVRSLGAALVSASVAIPLAVYGFGVWSLVAQHLAYSGAATLLVWTAARWRPRLTFSWKSLRAILSFSLGSFGARIGNFLAGQIDTVIIGFFWGPVAVGLYRMAARVVTIVLEFLSGPLEFVSLPDFSKLQGNDERFRQGLLAYTRLATLLTWPALAIVAVSAPYIPRVLGPQWVGVEYALAILAICGAVQALTAFLTPLLQSVGRTGTLAVLAWAQGLLGAAIFSAVGSISADWGLPLQTASIGMAKGLLLVLIPLPALLFASRHVIQLPMRQLLASVIPAGLCASAVGVASLAARTGLRFLGWSEFIQLPVLLLVGGLTWVSVSVTLNTSVRELVFVTAKRYAPPFFPR